MADPLLTSLCTICHVQTPKYKCPRCAVRTCSLPCIKKHKNWSSCSGERDPTVYMPASQLKTDAGIDHDYNFLHKIERSVETAEKILREERDLIPHAGPPPNKKARLHKGQSSGRVALDDNSRRWDRNCLQRIRQLGINVTAVPYGMSRQKENKTSWNKRTRSINWQVEWVVMDSEQPTRIMNKILDQTPLCEGFASTQEAHRLAQLSGEQKAEEKAQRPKPGRPTCQSSNSVWNLSPSRLQGPSGSWNVTQADGTEWQYFLQKPRVPTREAQQLVPLEAAEDLSTILPGHEIVEFPTIYVFPKGTDPGAFEGDRRGFVVEGEDEEIKKRKADLMEADTTSSSGSSSEDDSA